MLHHIVHVIPSLDVGGAERMLVKLCSVTRSSFRHSIITLLRPGSLAADAAAMGAEVNSLDLPRSLRAVLLLRRLRPQLNRLKGDLIQSWMYNANVAATLSCGFRRRQAPLIWNIRYTPDVLRQESISTQLAVAASILVARAPDHIIYNAERGRARHESLGFPQTKGTVIPNGFDVSKFLPDASARKWLRNEFGIPATSPVLGRIARDHSMKDHATLLRAFALVRQQFPSARLALVGAGMIEENLDLIRLAEQCGVAGALLLLGLRDDIARLTAAFDVALSSSSHGEGFPNVIGEAMASAVPFVGTDVGDNLAILGDSERIVAPRDEHALAAAVVKLLYRDEEYRRQIGLRDRERVIALFSINAIGNSYTQLWSEALSARLRLRSSFLSG